MSDVEIVSLFFGLLAVVAQLATVGLGGLAVAARFAPAATAVHQRVRSEIGPRAVGLAAAVAAVCVAGSLYYSEVANFPPCRLCWYQRIAMYPLVVLLGLATWRRDAGIRRYATPLAGIGAVIAAYHMVVERFPSLESGACEVTNPCSIIWVEPLGYLTIPTMTLSGFGLILILLAHATEDT
ncbi:MAG: disulfide bond formation protein B [Acidimicrobiales bacterium]